MWLKPSTEVQTLSGGLYVHVHNIYVHNSYVPNVHVHNVHMECVCIVSIPMIHLAI